MPDKTITSRSYRAPADLQAMLGLVRKRPLERAADFPGIIDLQELLAMPAIQAATRLWFDAEGALAGFAILDRDETSASVFFDVAPDGRGKALTEKVLAWAEDSIRLASPARQDIFTLEASASADNLARLACLEQLGFERQAGGPVHLERSLAEPISEAHLPPGFHIRPIQGEAEAADWVRLHRAAIGTQNMTSEYKLAMLQTPYYDPEMDLVAVAPDGALAAYCVCFINVEENALTGQKNGYTDPIATHPEFQRRGLSKALLLTGLTLLKQRGMDKACLGTSSENTAMLRTAEAVGFRVAKNILRFEKSIHFS